MARRVFFSFHYQRDSWRVSQVRNSWVCRADHEAQPFLDKAEWEKIKRSGDLAIRNWIERQLSGTSVTVVLIGAETSLRPWVRYELQRSYELKKGILGVRIHNLKNREGYVDHIGGNPLDGIYANKKNPWAGVFPRPLSEIYPTYDYLYGDGRQNLSRWIEEAASIAGR